MSDPLLPGTLPSQAHALPETLRCPLCGNALRRDAFWPSPRWLCTRGHSYSNARVLLAELRERGWLDGGWRPDPAGPAATQPPPRRRTLWRRG
jgi:hypothetical protein